MTAGIPVQTWMIGITAYPILQAVALVRLRGTLRGMSLILTVVMVAVVGLSVTAYSMDPSNLWQMFLMLATPPALVLTAGLLAIGSVVRRRRVA